MRYIGIISTCVIIVLVPLLIKLFYKKDAAKVKNKDEIRQPSLCLYIGIAGIILFDIGIPLICFLELDPSMTWFESLAFSSIILIPANFLYIYLLLLALNWKVTVFDDHIEYINCLKKKKIYDFLEYQIKTYSGSIRVVKAYKNKKNKKKYKSYVNISSYCTNTCSLTDKYKLFKEKQKAITG